MRTIREQLAEKGIIVSLRVTEALPDIKVSKRPEEKLSRKEWEEIMGMNRETYQKQGGAYRRKR